jgi:glutamine synthetase
VFQAFEEARRYLDEHSIQMVNLKYADLWGRWHHVTVPANQFTPSLLERGVGFDASSVGFGPLKAGDMIVVPDLSTGFLDP